MGRFRFTARAEADLLAVGTYTLHTWDAAQCARYLDGLEAACAALADNPELGRACEDVRPGLRRFEQGRHVVFYRIEPYGVRILRILHQRMLPERHLADDIE